MNDFLRLLLSLSFSGALLTGVAALLNRLLKGRIPHCFRYYLWLLVLLRFVCPFGTEYSLANQVVSQPTIFLVEDTGAWTIGSGGNDLEFGGAAAGSEQVPMVTHALPERSSVLLLAWAVGTAAALGIRLTGYFRFRKHLAADALAAEDWEQKLLFSLAKEKKQLPPLFRTAGTDTPMLVGVLRPRLYLPPIRMRECDLRYALRHELVHWRRKDLLYKWALVLIACVHWFNPAVWYLVRAVERDCELSCDEAVVWGLSQAERTGYGAMLLETAAIQSQMSGALSAPLWSKKHDLKERLYGIMKPTFNTKKAKCLLAAAVVLVATTSVALGAYVGQTVKPDTEKAGVTQPAGEEVENPAAALVSALAAEKELAWPFDADGNIVLSALYGERVHPITGETSNHTGIDIPLTKGTPVLAAASGEVITSEFDYDGTRGNYIVLSHGDMTTIYCHLETLSVGVGETVTAGQQIGTVGTTGASTGYHLHFEVREGDSRVDPLDYLPQAEVYIANRGQTVEVEY